MKIGFSAMEIETSQISRSGLPTQTAQPIKINALQ